MDILSFGEILFDIIDGGSYLGGAPLNFAAHMSKLGHRSYMLSRVGKDELGKRAILEITTLGVLDKFIQTDPNHSTGKVDISLSDGQPHYHFAEAANQANLLGGYVATQRGAIPAYSAEIKSVFYQKDTLTNQ